MLEFELYDYQIGYLKPFDYVFSQIISILMLGKRKTKPDGLMDKSDTHSWILKTWYDIGRDLKTVRRKMNSREPQWSKALDASWVLLGAIWMSLGAQGGIEHDPLLLNVN